MLIVRSMSAYWHHLYRLFVSGYYICQSKPLLSNIQSADSLFYLVKDTFSVHKLIPINTQMTTLYTNWSLYITFTMIYYIRQE